MQEITNQLIIEALQAYINGDNESIRPFSNRLLNQDGLEIDIYDLYKDENNNIFYPEYKRFIDDVIEGNEIVDSELTGYTKLMDYKEYKENLISYVNFIMTKNDIEDFSKDEQAIIKEVEEYANR